MKLAKLTLLVVTAFAAVALAVDKVPLADLVKEPKTYDGKTITVTGVVADFKQKTSRIGNKYFTFKLAKSEKEKDKDIVNVYSQGEAGEGVKDGAKVVVTGVFREEKKLKDFSVKNEIDATKVKDKENGVKVLKGLN
jgi:cytochrome c-type biogenesis protein CcmE